MEAHSKLSLLESLPQDILGDILSRVASFSRTDLRHCMTVSHTIASAAQDERIYNKVNLRPEAMNPLITYDGYQDLIDDQCIVSMNPVAHYIKGVKEYFIRDDEVMGLYHLRKSAEGSYDNGAYLYGILMLFTGNVDEGKDSLGSLDWAASKRRADRCWREVRISLRHIIVEMKVQYANSLIINKPPINCHKNGLDTRCRKCFLYKQMRKFIEYIE